MAYNRRRPVWKNYPDVSTPILAEDLNYIEDGLVSAAGVADTALSTASTASSRAEQAVANAATAQNTADAAQAAASAAQGSASTAQGAAVSAQASASSAATSAASSATSAQNAANLVGAPADTAIAAAVSGSTSQTRGALDVRYVPKWQPSTTYAAGAKVLNPDGVTVEAVAAFTSGASYSASDWKISTGLTKAFGSRVFNATKVSPVADLSFAVCAGITTLRPFSVGVTDGVVYGRFGGALFAARTNSAGTALNGSVNFATKAEHSTAGGAVRWAGQTSAGYLVITTTTANTYVWLSTNTFTTLSDYSLKLTVPFLCNDPLGVGIVGSTADGRTVLGVGVWNSGPSVKPYYVSFDGGANWINARDTWTTPPDSSGSVNSHWHSMVYDRRWDRLWISGGDGPNSYFGYSNDAQWLATAIATAPAWAASTPYYQGQIVKEPGGTYVKAKTAFTSGASYNAANWDPAGSPTWHDVPISSDAFIADGKTYQQPTVMVAFDDRISVGPDRGAFNKHRPGVWELDPSTGYTVPKFVIDTTVGVADQQYPVQPYAKSGNEAYIAFPCSASMAAGTRDHTDIAGTADGGRTWYKVARISWGGADLSANGIVGPDVNGYLYHVGSAGLQRAKVCDWTAL